MGGYDAYSASKGCTELATHSYINAFFSGENASQCAIATARAGNVIGGGDWAEDRLVPDILFNLSENKPIEIRSPGAVRPWQHVLEPLSGYMSLAQHLFEVGGRFSGGWNFGPNDEGAKTVSWIADVMVEKWGRGTWFVSEQTHPHEATYLKLDSSKARAELSWSPVWNPSEAIDATIRWHKCWLDNQNMTTETLRDIEQYTADRSALCNG
jgi:CDP-glucose 4,6-dehydratase